MRLQSVTGPAAIAAFVVIVGVDAMVSLYAAPFPVLNLTLSFFSILDPSNHSRDSSDCQDNGGDCHREGGRRFVLIWAELRRMDRIQRGGKEGNTKALFKIVGRPERLRSEETGKLPVFGLWMRNCWLRSLALLPSL